MIRAFRFFVLLAAFFVVIVRCMAGFPLLLASGSGSSDHAQSELRPAQDEPVQADALAAVELADEVDDDAEAFVAPRLPELSGLFFGSSADACCGNRAEQRALPSHAPNLERPPRG